MEPDLHKGITISTSTKINTLSQVIIANSEGNLQREYSHYKTAKNFEMEISPKKSETMAFVGQDPVRCKIMDNTCLQPVKNFIYLICGISYENK